MNAFCLMDGAMAVAVLSTSKIFNDPGIPWLAPLLPTEQLRLVGPFLVDFRALAPGGLEREELNRALAAYPRRLHAAQIDTELSISALAQHLGRFAAFRDSYGDTYALRIADARVMMYLPRFLTERQWRELSAPIAKWQITDRNGAGLTIHESNSTGEVLSDEPEIFTLNDEQVEQLMQANEPDALLHAIGKPPTLQEAGLMQLHYDAACACVAHWKSTGSASRGVLDQFSRLVFECDPARFKDRAWLHEKFQQALKTTA